MARYMERASYMCRLLHIQSEALVDRPVSEIQFGWRRIYTAIIETHSAEFKPWVRSTTTTWLTRIFSPTNSHCVRDNPESVLSCLERGRENARQIPTLRQRSDVDRAQHRVSPHS